MVSERASRRTFVGVSAIFFAVSAAVTVLWCASMSTMGEMRMPGGWTMSMLWMRMPEQSWLGAAASFLGMWVAMMVSMMLPSLAPMLWRYRQGVAMTGETRLARLTALLSLGYFLVWAVLGMAVFLLGVVLAVLEVKLPVLARAVPAAAGGVVMVAGALQFTKWKAHQLACCRMAPTCSSAFAPVLGVAWRQGLGLGLRCSGCCAGLTAALLAVGVMNLPAMAVVTVAITVERLAPAAVQVTRAVGVIAFGAGLLLIVRAARLG